MGVGLREAQKSVFCGVAAVVSGGSSKWEERSSRSRGIQGSRREVTTRAGVCTRSRRQVACASARARASTPSSSSRCPSSSRSSSSRSSPTAARWRGARRSTHRGRGRRACSRCASKSSSSCYTAELAIKVLAYGRRSYSRAVCDCSYVQHIWHLRECATAHWGGRTALPGGGVRFRTSVTPPLAGAFQPLGGPDRPPLAGAFLSP